MSTTVKVLLGIAAFFVLCIGIVGWKAYSWWRANGQVYLVAVKTSAEDGKTYGRTSDSAGCVKNALDRFGSDTTTLGTLQAAAYSQNCLTVSKPSAGFCDGVPQPRDFSAAREWARAKCDAIVTENRHTCPVVLGQVPRFCHPEVRNNG